MCHTEPSLKFVDDLPVCISLFKKNEKSWRENRLNASCTLWEYILATYGYSPGSENLQEERIYHAIFEPTFHRSCFLSLSITPNDTDAILTFGYLADIWEWERYREILSALRKNEFPVLADEARVYLMNMQKKALEGKYELPFFPNEESFYVRDVQMAAVPLDALQRFRQHMLELHPLGLHTPNATAIGRDGMLARGIVTDRHCTHRFDLWTVEKELTNRHRAFFHALIDVGYASFEAGVQGYLNEIRRYLLSE
jgi:hypothetical protein